MPKIDPHTGCKVATMGEVLTNIAEAEGTTPGEIMDDISSAIEEDNRKMEAQYRDPSTALRILQKHCGDDVRSWAKDRNPLDLWSRKYRPLFSITQRPRYPIAVLEVLDASHSQSFRSTSSSFTARVKCDDGSIQIMMYDSWYQSGTYTDPPDGESSVSIVSEASLRRKERRLEKKRLKAEFRAKMAKIRTTHIQSWAGTVVNPNDPFGGKRNWAQL